MPGLFINYRNDDQTYAPLLLDRELVRRFGAHNVFRAGRSLPLARDFRPEILRRVAECDLLLALIGPSWSGPENLARLRDPEDWVRQEIVLALESDIPVLPVLLDGRGRPSAADLPEQLGPLTVQHDFRLHHRTVESDLARLIAGLEELVPGLVLDTLLRPPLPQPPSELPAALLLPGYEIGPFQPRPELDELVQWYADPQAATVLLLVGGLGEGKTRLALELCRRLRQSGHPAGLLSGAGGTGVADRLADVTRPSLLVIDDADAAVDQVRRALRAVHLRGDSSVRLLLLARSAGDWLAGLTVDADDAVAAPAGRVLVRRLRPWPPDRERGRVVADAAVAFSRELGRPAPVVPVPAGGTVLELVAAALVGVLDPDTAPGSALRRVLDLERSQWSRTGAHLPDVHPARLDQLVAAATLFGADSGHDVGGLLSVLPTFDGAAPFVVDRYVEWLRSTLPSAELLPPLRPDRLGEDLVARTVAGPAFRLASVTAAVTDRQAARALAVLARSAARHPGLVAPLTELLGSAPDRLVPLAMEALPAVPQPVAFVAALTSAVDQVSGPVLDAIVEALPQRSEPLAALAVVATRRALTSASGSGADPARTAALARLLAVRLVYQGTDLAEAEAAARSAADAPAGSGDDRTVQRAEAGAVLALVLAARDDLAGAIAAGDAAIAAYRGCRPPAPGGLTTALHNQSVRRKNAGDLTAASALATEARELAGPLAADRPQAYLSLYADVVDNSAVVAALTGDLAGARAFGGEALTLRRRLATARPDAYRRQLAGTLVNLGIILARSGDEAAARAARAEADELYRGLDPG